MRVPVPATRRSFCTAAAAASLLSAMSPWPGGSQWIAPAFAQAPSVDDLMQAGPFGDQWQGSPDAPITMIEYASVTCPHCADFAVNVYPALKARYIDTGKVRYVLREFPFDRLAAAGFMLTRCAGSDKYFDLVEVLFEKQRDWVVEQPLEPLLAIARQAGFSQQSFEQCLANQNVLDGIDWVRKRAVEKFAVDATPTFFINGTRHRGEIMREALDATLTPYLDSGKASR